MPSADDPGVPAPPAPGAIRVAGHERLDLDRGWEVAGCAPDACATPAEAEGLDWIAATVPGTVAGALAEAGLWRPQDERDLDQEDWWFRTSFEAAPVGEGEIVLLRLDGVATFHEIFLNGERVHAGDSMFAPAAIDVGGVLRRGGNELAIRCLALAGKLGAKRKPRARWRTKLADNRLRFVRTMLLGRCPGFAAGPAAVGPFRPVWVERRRRLAVSGFELRPRVEGRDGILDVAITMRGLGGFEATGVTVRTGGASAVEAALEVVASSGEGEVEARGELTVPGARLWWPHTHGEPTLHDISIAVSGPGGEIEIDGGRVGFRALAAGPGNGPHALEEGLDLHLNGTRIFVRGAVWTPDDFVGMAPDRERLLRALRRIRDAGMNMVRVPGTAAYESPDFHDLCDELGILVWQDFMFANFDYPSADEEFRATVEAEARERVAALAGRPSTAVFCGNSEVEQQVGMLGLDPEAGRGELFGEILPSAIAAAGTDALYVPSSPSGGARPFRPDVGIANYYGVGGYRRPLTDARLAEVRFAGECLAFANVPEERGVEAVLPEAPGDVVVHHPRWKAGVPRDAGTGWDFDDVRDHYLRELFGVDPGELRRYDHARYLELSRMASGEAMAAVFGEWRRAGSPCGGGLVLWQRDLVPGAGWGLIDQGGEPKAAWHLLRRRLAPRAVWMTDEGLAGVGVHVANDLAEPLDGSLRLGLYRKDGRVVGEARTRVELGPHEARSLDLESVLGRFADASWAYRFGPPAQDVIFASLELGEEDPEPISQEAFFPVRLPSEADSVAAAGLEAEAAVVGDGVALTLRSRRPVYGLRVSADGALAEDSFLTLEPGADRVVRLARDDASPMPTKVTLTAVGLEDRLVVTVAG